MAETEPKDPRPIKTKNGRLIVYLIMGEAGVYVDCPALGYSIGMPRAAYKEEAVKHSFETIIRSNSMAILSRVSNGEQFPDKSIEYAQRCADDKIPLPLIYIKQFRRSYQFGF